MFPFKKKLPSPYDHERKHERIRVFIPVKVTLPDGATTEGEIGDISLGGAFLILKKGKVAVGETVRVELHLSGLRSSTGEAIEFDEVDPSAPLHPHAEGQIRWGQANTGFGIQFQHTSPPMQKFIKRLVKCLKDFEMGLYEAD